MSAVFPVILSGGSGTRLWPLSRKHYPKQLLSLTNGELTMLQETVKRVHHLDAPIVVCNDDHRFMVAEQLRAMDVKQSSIILEPVARNTAPAIALAALAAKQQDAEAVIVVLPADHAIHAQEAFQQSLNIAIDAAKQGDLITFGIVPTKPETGYGYIKASQCEAHQTTQSVLSVDGFVEKPALDVAQHYVESSDYFWNSGMFVFKAQAYLDALAQYSADILKACESAFQQSSIDLDFMRINEAAFAKSPDISIDYAVMERATNVKMVPFSADWSDVGSWSSLWEIAEKDANNNAFLGDVIDIDTRNTLVHSADKLTAVIGLEDVVIVDTKDALLVSKADSVQQVKAVVEHIKQAKRSEHLAHREVHRPWGCYDSIDSSARYQVKRIKVKPGASLSLQMHHHRSEHWVIVKGTALVQVGETERILPENQSIYIPIGEKHRLTNPGKITLELIEVQSGDYLGEDDIVRFEDMYRRE